MPVKCRFSRTYLIFKSIYLKINRYKVVLGLNVPYEELIFPTFSILLKLHIHVYDCKNFFFVIKHFFSYFHHSSHIFFVGKQKKNFQDWRLNKKWRRVQMKLVINQSLSELNLKRAALWHWHSQPPCWILYCKWLPPAVRFMCSKTHWSFCAWVFICSVVLLISHVHVHVPRYVRTRYQNVLLNLNCKSLVRETIRSLHSAGGDLSVVSVCVCVCVSITPQRE